ncbi:MAG: hypothetical protein WBD28_04180, partial [Candidatus Zixiibacteriota bacterium]
MKQNKKEQDKEKFNILVYGIDRFGYALPSDSLEAQNYIVNFKGYKTEEKFQEYDGVIVFQSNFETAERRGFPSGMFVDCDREELVRRKIQLEQLLRRKGFACFLLTRDFVDRQETGSARNTDLAKLALNYANFFRESLGYDCTNLRIVRDEFRDFLNSYGVAKTKFEDHHRNLNLRPICYCGNLLTGFILLDRLFFLPAYQPKYPEFKEFFPQLAQGLVTCFRKLSQELPSWADEYRFEDEKRLLLELEGLNVKIETINTRLSTFKNYKRCLCYDDEFLKESLISILEDGFDFNIDPEDKLKEDFKIIDDEDKPLVLVEVKGTNRGVQRDFVNQADSHRERNNLPPDFPSILIVNTNIKKASSIEDKYQDVAEEQIKHAVKMNILVLRT